MSARAPELGRRGALAAACALYAGVALAAGKGGKFRTPLLREVDLELPGDPRLANRARLLIPTALKSGQRVPALVLLHGLGETNNPPLALRAWSELYGAAQAYDRLTQAPVKRLLDRQRYLTDERLAQLNTMLAKRPFQPLVLVCPVTPHPSRPGPPSRTFARYSQWLKTTLIPAVQREAPVHAAASRWGLDGCSLGGYVGMEVFLRIPEMFSSYGTIQGAFGVSSGRRYAEALAAVVDKHGPRSIHVESSGGDPYLAANRALSRRLTELNVPHELRAPAGPHDQRWLREVGTLELLLWHSRQLHG